MKLSHINFVRSPNIIWSRNETNSTQRLVNLKNQAKNCFYMTHVLLQSELNLTFCIMMT